MAQQSILPIDISQGIDQSAAECVGAPRIADAQNIRICGPGDVRAAPGYSALSVAVTDSANPTKGQLVGACSTDGTGTLGLIHQDDDFYLARLVTGSSQRLWWSRMNGIESSRDIPQLGGIYSRVLGAPNTTVGGNEQSLCHSVQVHAHATLGIIAVVNSSDGVVGTTVNRPTNAVMHVLQKGVVVSSLPLTDSSVPGLYGTCPIIRDGYMAAMFGSYSGAGPYTWSGSLIVWRLSDMTSATALPTPVWTQAVSVAGLASKYGTPTPVMALSPDGNRLAVAIPGYGLLVRRLDVPGTSGPTAFPTSVPSIDIIWSTDNTRIWAGWQDAAGSGAVYVARYSNVAAVVEAGSAIVAAGVALSSAGPPFMPYTWVRALGYVHLLYVGARGLGSGANEDGAMIAATYLDTATVAGGYAEIGIVDYGHPASRPLLVSTDRGYMLTRTYSEGQTVLRTTYAMELRFSTTAPRIVAEMAGTALEGQTPHNVQMQGLSSDLRAYSQLSSLALAATELQEPQLAHVLEGVLTPSFIVAGAVLSPDPFAASVASDVDRNPRVGVLLSWETLTSSTVTHTYTKGMRARSVAGGSLTSHGAPLWITPVGRDIPGFPDVIPSFYAATGGGGTIAAGSYQLCFVAEHVDALGLVHRSPPSYPVTLAPGSSNQTFTINAPAGIPIYGRTDVGGGVAALGYALSLYMTQAGGSIFYLVRRAVTPGTTITVTAVPATSSPVLYTQTGQVPRYSPPQMSCLAIGKERALAGGVWRPTEVRFSLLMVPGEGLAWPHPSYPQWRVQLPSDVRSVAALGDAWAVFCASGIYVITGDGPDDNGAGGSFSPPQRVSILSLASCKSVVEADEGVYFQASDGHMYLMQTGSAQCERITDKIRDSFGVSRLNGSGPEWQTVMGATIDSVTGDLCLAQWGDPNDTAGVYGMQTVWRYARIHGGAWSRDVAQVAYVAGYLPPCLGLYELRLPGNGYTLFCPNNAQQVAVQAQGSFYPTSSPTARVVSTWMSPFGPHGDGQVSGLSILSGFPRRSEEYDWGTDSTAPTIVVSILREHDGTPQTGSLLPYGAYGSRSTTSPSWLTVETDLQVQTGRQLQVTIEWLHQRVSVASMALQASPTARFERISDSRSG